MRVNLIIQYSNHRAAPGTVPISLTIRPASGLPGDYEYATDSAALFKLLGRQTELPSTVLQRFESTLQESFSARLMGVELSESVLTEIGYFLD